MVYGTTIDVVRSCGRPFSQLPRPEPLPPSARIYGLQKKGVRHASTVITNEQQLFQHIDIRGTYDATVSSDPEFTPTALGGSKHVGLSPQYFARDQGTRSVVHRADHLGPGPGRGLRTSLWGRVCNHLCRCGPPVSAWARLFVAKCLHSLVKSESSPSDCRALIGRQNLRPTVALKLERFHHRLFAISYR